MVREVVFPYQSGDNVFLLEIFEWAVSPFSRYAILGWKLWKKLCLRSYTTKQQEWKVIFPLVRVKFGFTHDFQCVESNFTPTNFSALVQSRGLRASGSPSARKVQLYARSTKTTISGPTNSEKVAFGSKIEIKRFKVPSFREGLQNLSYLAIHHYQNCIVTFYFDANFRIWKILINT